MLIVHVDVINIASIEAAYRLLAQQGVGNVHINQASLVMIRNRDTNRYYVVKNRATGSLGWVDPWEAKALMQAHIDSLSEEVHTPDIGSIRWGGIEESRRSVSRETIDTRFFTEISTPYYRRSNNRGENRD